MRDSDKASNTKRAYYIFLNWMCNICIHPTLYVYTISYHYAAGLEPAQKSECQNITMDKIN